MNLKRKLSAVALEVKPTSWLDDSFGELHSSLFILMRSVANSSLFILHSSFILLLFVACSKHPSLPSDFTQLDAQPSIWPDYTGVTVPPNIAPLNFLVDSVDDVVALIGEQTYGGKDNKVQIDEDEWHEMLAAAKGKSLSVNVYTRKDGKWFGYKPFVINVAEDEIDPYISYRVLPPTFVGFDELAIRQRNLTNFEETDIYNNRQISKGLEGQCINCHSYQNYRTDNMMFHTRLQHPGTMIVSDLPKERELHTITGVAGRKGLSVIQVEKMMVSDGAGFTAIILDVFKHYGVPFEQCLTGIDTVTVIIRSDYFKAMKYELLNAIEDQVHPDTLIVKANLAMIAVVGEADADYQGSTVCILGAISAAGIDLNTINQGAGSLNLIIGVEEKDYEKAVRAVYNSIL